ncbi:MAG: helix-turn-helix domain-containing protein [Propionibacteriales bacterium]|nr:helix-turn-helix domain-containing protein [Propionibacteriales bacterium]
MPALWTDRVWHEFHAGNLTRGYRDVLLTLRTFRGTGGLCVPSHATLADRARCSSRTVQRALVQAQVLGLVSWTERRVRAGWRWLRTSNAYRLAVPDRPVQSGMRTPFSRSATCPATTGQTVRGGESLSKKGALQDMLVAAASLPNLLAIRRAAIEGRLVPRQ